MLSYGFLYTFDVLLCAAQRRQPGRLYFDRTSNDQHVEHILNHLNANSLQKLIMVGLSQANLVERRQFAAALVGDDVPALHPTRLS